MDIDNYLPKESDLPKYEYSTFLGYKGGNDVFFSQHQQETPLDEPWQNLTLPIEVASSTFSPIPIINNSSDIFTMENYTDPVLDPLNDTENEIRLMNRTSRQELKNSTSTGSQLGVQLEAQEEGESDEEEGNMITGLIGALLGGILKPDGSIDTEAITGLLGSLSTQNPDGTFDFMGVTDLLRGFFGGGDGGGGSDIGSFVGGLVGALLQGIANPPGAKGVGKLTGSVVAGILPSLSAPPLDENGEPQAGIDPFGFVGGFLKTFLNGSSTSTAPANQTDTGKGNKSKFSIFKAIISTITSLFSASSGSSSSCMPTMLC
ncbi:uncharacterized protein LOC123309827 isoform X2 [Coccinella septempunctata]|uniref:uncharacterized protein LOC123309827 isoform X2 n=1 Tax=Coccinella septempunctata TaxID=41139 RepID=UPI001D074F4F|nr:uncharacterized protein LOC123309827 isoform X2 [Coccinella septempunctata]